MTNARIDQVTLRAPSSQEDVTLLASGAIHSAGQEQVRFVQ